MNDMDMLKRLGDSLSPPATEPTSLRQPAFGSHVKTATRPRWQLQLGLTATAALVVIAAIFSINSQKYPVDDELPQPAAAVLQNAALAARTSGTVEPRPDQYIFTEIVSSTPNQVQQPDGLIRTIAREPVEEQMWLSADGTQSSTSRQRPYGQNQAWTDMPPLSACGTRLDPQEATGRSGENEECSGRPGFEKSVPHSPGEALAWLYGKANHQQAGQASPSPSYLGPHDPQQALAFETAKDVLAGGTYLVAEQRAALFEAVAAMPGVTTVKNARDGAGRSGVGVRMAESDLLVFDAASYDFLGTSNTAVIRQAIVDQPGQLPS